MSVAPIQVLQLLRASTLVFWDFDGVIKDSVEVKSAAFEQLFLVYGTQVASRVRRHHEANGGLSRYEKMPVYLSWAGEPAGEEQIRQFCDRFSQLVLQAVINSAWVPGVREYLEDHYASQRFVLVTGTPEDEMRQILGALGIAGWFSEVHGAPKAKRAVICDVLGRFGCQAERALSVGDSDSDSDAAAGNGVPFLLRRTALNRALQARLQCPYFDRLDLQLPTGTQT